MPAANLCELCKSQTTPHDSPSGSSNRSSARSSTIPRGPSHCTTSSPSKPVYVRIDPSERTCIVLGQGDGGGGNCNKLKLNNCIEIVGDSIIKSAKGGLQISSGGKGKGGMQISLPGKGGCPVVQLGGGSGRNCGSSANASGGMGRGVQVCPGRSRQLQLSFGNAACGGGGPSIICGPGGQNVEIFYGPQKRKLDMNHCKPTIAFMIHKRLIELENELRMTECAYSDLHP